MAKQAVRVWVPNEKSEYKYDTEGCYVYGELKEKDEEKGTVIVVFDGVPSIEYVGSLASLGEMTELVCCNDYHVYTHEIFRCDVDLIKESMLDVLPIPITFNGLGLMLPDGGIGFCVFGLDGEIERWIKLNVDTNVLNRKIEVIGDTYITPEYLSFIPTIQ